MALWYLGAEGAAAGDIAAEPVDSAHALACLAAGQNLLTSGALASTIITGGDTNRFHRISLEVKTRRLITFEGRVSRRGAAKLDVRIDVLFKPAKRGFAVTTKHSGRPVDPQGEMFSNAMDHFRKASSALFLWIAPLLAAGRLDYRSQSPKLRLDEQAKWGHPFPFSPADLNAYRHQIEQALDQLPGMMSDEWRSRPLSGGSTSQARQRRQAIINALPEGAPLAFVDGDRLYGGHRIRIGRKRRSFGPKAAGCVRLLSESDLELMQASPAFSLSRHDILGLTAQIRALRAEHPDAIEFELPYLALKQVEGKEVFLDRDPRDLSFDGMSHPAPTSQAGTLGYDWIQPGIGGEHAKEFFPAREGDASGWAPDFSPLAASQRPGHQIDLRSLPKKLCYRPKPFAPALKLQDAVAAGGFWIVSDSLRDLLSQFSLGSTRFHPVDLLDSQGGPLGLNGWSYMLPGEWRQRFSKTGSPKAISIRSKQTAPYSLTPHSHDLVHLSAAEQNGPDLWLDPDVRACFFVSGTLAQALRKSGLTLRLGLKRCLPAR